VSKNQQGAPLPRRVDGVRGVVIEAVQNARTCGSTMMLASHPGFRSVARAAGASASKPIQAQG